MKYTIENLPKEFKFTIGVTGREYCAVVKSKEDVLVSRNCNSSINKMGCVLEYLNDGGWKMVEEKPKFKAMKFKIKDKEHSKAVQEHLLNLGYKWNDHRLFKKEPTKAVLNFIATDVSGSMRELKWGIDFENCKHKEYTLKETTTYSLEPVKETVEILGVSVDKEKAVAFLESLQ